MYGAMIGDIVGSKYEFCNIKTKDFPLFSQGCNYTDDTIMTAAVAKAIMLSRQEQYKTGEKGKSFQAFLVETMQDFGRRYPHPTGAYGGKFAQWLRQEDPKPYGSYGNGSAMRASPCGLAAVVMEEALALARASASVTHDHPEGIKGAEAVSAAVFLAKCGRPKEEIRQYITEHYYDLNFTLDSIRDSYRFDGSCQGSVPQAIVAFLESVSFEDAIRNVISIGGDCDTTGAITGAIAWVYYAIQTGGYPGWVYNKFDPAMLEIRERAMKYLPKEFVEIADEFHEVCWTRAGTHCRVGGCTSILNSVEFKIYWPKPEKAVQKDQKASWTITNEMREAMTGFCRKYIVLMELLYKDQELNQWCHSYSAFRENTQHCELKSIIYDKFVKDAYRLQCMQDAHACLINVPYTLESALKGSETELIRGIWLEIRSDHQSNGSLIAHAIADGKLYRLMDAYLSYVQRPQYTLEYIEKQMNKPKVDAPGACEVRYDLSMKKWQLRFQLDKERVWFLSVFVHADGRIEKYSLDKEVAEDSHYEFVEERKVRSRIYIRGDEDRYLHQTFVRFVKEHSGNALLWAIKPYITQQFHYD